MPNAAELKPDGRFMALFVGPKHSGKTVAATSFEFDTNKKTKVDDFDGRIRGILGAPWIKKNRIDYTSYPPKTMGNQSGAVYDKAMNEIGTMMVQLNTNSCPYEGLIADSLTAETFAFLSDSIPITHTTDKNKQKGKHIGSAAMAGPEDYGFEATATYNYLAVMRSLPLRFLIATAHVVDRFGKKDPDDPFSESIVVGEKLSLRDKIGTNIGIYFDHIFRFDRRMYQGKEHHYVTFRGGIACTSFPDLPYGEIDITGKSFHEVLKSYLKLD